QAGRGGGLVMGDYLLLAEIGAGGMGKVYKAQHRRMKRVVALKVMSSAAMQDDAAVKRFQREVEAAARLEHPNIVTAYDSGEAGKVKYLVMQFVDGGDLSDFVKKNGALPIEAAVGYVMQAAKGLAFAHAAGVVHRDIKPANLLLDKKGVVKILDMGLARIEDGDGLTATEQVMGTVDYMSPEQAAETKNADGRSDIYSLGCTLWFLLTAKKLYDGDTMISRLMKHRDAELPSLVKTRDDATWPLEQVLHKMIAKRPQDRYQSMDEVVAALEPFAGGGATGGGMGSSIGGGKGQSAELAQFMQAMAGAPNSSASVAAQAAKPATSTAVDATAAFSASEIGTDPKSALHTRALPPIGGAATGGAKTQVKAVRKKSPPVKLIAAGVVGIALLLAGVFVVIKDKSGNVVAELNAPTGVAVEVRQTPVVAAASVSLDTSPGARVMSIADILDSADYVWTEPENLGPNVNGPGDEEQPSVTGDLCRLYFGRKGDKRYEAVRDSAVATFGPAFPGLNVKGASISGDGLSIVSVTGASEGGSIQMSRRLSFDAKWSPSEPLPPEANGPGDAKYPRLSPDGLTLLFSSGAAGTSASDVWQSRRKSLIAPFEPAVKLDALISTPNAGEQSCQQLADGRTLVFRRDGTWCQTFTNATGTKAVLPLREHPFQSQPDVWFAADGQTAFFTATLPGGLGGSDIYVTRRVPKSGAGAAAVPPVASTPSPVSEPAFTNVLDATDYMWTEPENLGPTINGPGDQNVRSLTNDQLRMVFTRAGGSPGAQNHLYEATRASLQDPFGTPRAIYQGNGSEAYLSGDGLTLAYPARGPGNQEDLFTRRRATLNDEFGDQLELGPQISGPMVDRRPTFSPDGLSLVFSSDRNPTTTKGDLWISRRSSLVESFGPPSSAGAHVNSSDFENYGLILSDNRTLLFYRNRGGWHTTFTNSQGRQGAIPLLDHPFGHTMNLWITPEGRTAYFSADRPGGLGGQDIYVTRRVPKASSQPTAEPAPSVSPKSGTSAIAEILTSSDYDWTPPENLGPTINGPGDEADPSLTGDLLRILYRRKSHPGGDHAEAARAQVSDAFGPPTTSLTGNSRPFLSSNGFSLLVSAGDTSQDLQIIQRPALDGKWGFPTSLGRQINSLGDERNPTLSPDGLTLVFRTNRMPEMKTDLWISRRKSPAESFGPAESLGPLVNTNDDESFGMLVGDGRTLVFRRGRAWQVTTLGEGGAQSVRPLHVGSLASLNSILELWMSHDGRKVYFSAELPGGHGGFDVWTTRRVLKNGSSPLPRPNLVVGNPEAFGPTAPPPAVFPFDAQAAVNHQEAWAKHLGVPVEFTNDVGMKFRLIPPGEFQMGLGPEFTDEELKRLTSEKNDPIQKRLRSSRPAHPVRITRPFYMEVEEVTVGRYRDVVGQLRPEMETDPGKPLANYVTFADAITFCNKLSEREKKRPAYRMEGEQITLIDDAD
ncbi:MAG: protein kinase, partial [Planctomycetaceae bacterium]|nr:protein kinase [Planctomycetaceae bacterium]